MMNIFKKNRSKKDKVSIRITAKDYTFEFARKQLLHAIQRYLGDNFILECYSYDGNNNSAERFVDTFKYNNTTLTTSYYYSELDIITDPRFENLCDEESVIMFHFNLQITSITKEEQFQEYLNNNKVLEFHDDLFIRIDNEHSYITISWRDNYNEAMEKVIQELSFYFYVKKLD